MGRDRFTSPWVRFAVVLAVTLAVRGRGASAQPVDANASVRPAGEDAARLLDPSTTPEIRAAAAARVVSGSGPEARAAVERVLAPGAGLPEARDLVLRAIAATPSAQPWLLPHLAGLLGDPATDPSTRAAVTGAVSSIRTREAAKLLLDRLGQGAGGGRPDGARDEAFAALIRLSGHAEFGADANRWRLWYEQVQWLTEAEWRRELAEALAARTDAAAAERAAVLVRLTESLRQQYLAVDSIADRSARLAEFLRDPVDGVRRLGIELARQETANARTLDPAVGEAAVDLLSDPAASTRRQAAELVNLLVPSGQADRVTAALVRESDPQVAALLLRAASRWPSRDLTAVIVSWLEAGPPAATPACDAIDALDRRGWLTDRAARDAVIRVLREWLDREPGSVPPSGLRLLAGTGSEADRQRVFGLLHDREPAIRWAAATAIAQVGDAGSALEALADAARTDSALFQITAQAIIAARPTAAGFQLLARLPAPDPVQARERLLALAAELPHSELLRAARSTPDASLREAMLARLLREPLASQRVSGSPRTLKPEVIAGLLTLVDTRFELGQPAGALAALDALSAAADRIDPAVLNERRVVALIWLNRLDEAAKLDATRDAWLEGLERCVGLDHAAAAVAACRSRFPEPWPPGLAERLRDISVRMIPAGQP